MVRSMTASLVVVVCLLVKPQWVSYDRLLGGFSIDMVAISSSVVMVRLLRQRL